MANASPNHYPKTDLTLSAAPDLDGEHARVAAVIDRELRRIARMRRAHLAAAATIAERRLLDYVLGRS